MSGDFMFTAKIVSPVKCIEKPWDLWVSEIGHSSPRHDEDETAEARVGLSARRVPEPHPYKAPERSPARYRRSGHHRLSYDSMNLHGLFPQMDNLNAAVCHMCGMTVKCSAVYRHLLESHTGAEPILPPPPPAPTVKLKTGHSRSRHKKEMIPPPPPIEPLPVKMETSPIHTATAPLSRIVRPQPEMQYLDDASSSSGVTGEVQVCVESGELPVVSIQDTEDLPLGDNITDDIFAIMNSEGIQTADDIANSADWKKIIRDIGNMQDINFSQPLDPVQSQDMYTPLDTSSLSAYAIADTDLSSLQFAPSATPMVSTVMDSSPINVQPQKPAPIVAPIPPTKSRSKSSKPTKFNTREYDPNKHCGVVTADNPKPCTRSLTCKAHALSLRRTVEGRIKPFDQLLLEHRAARDAAHQPPAPTPAPVPVATALPIAIPQLLVNTSTIDLSAFNGLTPEQQVNDIYASLLSVEDPNAMLPDTSNITSLLSQPLPSDSFLLPDEADSAVDVPILSIASPLDPLPVKLEQCIDEGPPPLVPGDVCWYSSCPRPLALCSFNAAHAGGAITLGKRFATVRSNIKSSLSRSQCKSTSGSNFYFGQNALSLSKTVHMNNASKTNKPEVRKLIVTCSATSGMKETPASFSELFGGAGDVRLALNGHVERRRPGALKAGKRSAPAASPAPLLDLGFVLDPLLADEKC